MLYTVEVLSPSLKLQDRQINLGKNIKYPFFPGNGKTWKTCERGGCISTPAVQPLRPAAGSQGKQLDSQGWGVLIAHTVLMLLPLLQLKIEIQTFLDIKGDIYIRLKFCSCFQA